MLFRKFCFTVLKVRAHRTRCFLAVKHASAAMAQTSASHGKDTPGGSIILTASSALFEFLAMPFPSNPLFYVAAGIRSGAGTVDCKSSCSRCFVG